MKTIHLAHFHCLANNNALQKLNRLVGLHDTLMPHQVAVATGCPLAEAMGVLMLLLSQAAAEGFLLVYHANGCDNPPPPFLQRDLVAGPPPLPLTCLNCGVVIEDEHELSYDFLFKLTDQVSFEE